MPLRDGYEYWCHIQGCPPGSTTAQTLRYATKGFATGAADAPAHEYYDERLRQPVDISRNTHAPGATYGRALFVPGELVLDNADGALDFLKNWATGGYTVTLYRRKAENTFASAQLAFYGKLKQPQVGTETVTFGLIDTGTALSEPLVSTRYLGTNVGSVGLEGTANDIKDKRKPRLYGKRRRIPMVCVNAPLFIYQISDKSLEITTKVEDKGVEIFSDTFSGIYYTSIADMMANTPQPNQYRLYNGYLGGGSYVRFGTKPIGNPTCDASEHVTTPLLTSAANIATRMLTDYSTDRGNPTLFTARAADVTALNTANSAPLGLWVYGDDTLADCLDKLMNTVGGWWAQAYTNEVLMQRLELPAGTMALTIVPDMVKSYRSLQPTDALEGRVVWRQVILFDENLFPETDLATSVSIDRASEVKEQWRSEPFETEDTALRVRFLDAQERVDKSLFVNRSDAAVEAERRQLLNALVRHLFEVTVQLDDETAAIDLGMNIGFLIPRFNLALDYDEVGTFFKVIGVQPDAMRDQVTWIIWGASLDRANRITTFGDYRITTSGDVRITH